MANRSGKMRQAWQEGKFANRKTGVRWNSWTKPMDDFLRRHEGKLTPTRMAEALSDEFGVPRTANGILHRIALLGLSPHSKDYTLQQVARYLGIDAYTAHSWLICGYLQGEKLTPGKRGGVWVIKPESLELLIRNHPEMCNPNRMPSSKWRSLAEMVWSRDPIYTAKEVAIMLKASPNTIGDYIRKGWISATPRLDKNGRTVRWYIKRSQLSHFFVRAYSSLYQDKLSMNKTCEPAKLGAPTATAACF